MYGYLAHHGIVDLCSNPSEVLGAAQIPPTAVGGSFKSFLSEQINATFESRQRKLADRSSPYYLFWVVDE
jgi:hypothetical protein